MSGSIKAQLLNAYRDLIEERYGIRYSPAKMFVLEGALDKVKHLPGVTSLDWLFGEIQQGKRQAEDLLLSKITIGHTFFFREEEHFAKLTADILKNKVARPLIWCAASSSGEEPYSIIISLLEAGISDFLLVASDINRKVLTSMHRGVFHKSRLLNVNPTLLLKYFTKAGTDSYRVRANLRHYLKIKRLNLTEDLDFERRFDYIFCRNVIIYFDKAGSHKVITNLVHNLKKMGLLFLGLTEALLDRPAELHKDGHSIFRRL